MKWRVGLAAVACAVVAGAVLLWPEPEVERPRSESAAPRPAPTPIERVGSGKSVDPLRVNPIPYNIQPEPPARDAGAPAATFDAGTGPADGGLAAAATSFDSGFAQLVALETVAAPAPQRAEPPAGTDPRFGLRWSLPGHCGPGFESVEAARANLLATFPVTTLQGARFFHDPDVEPARVLVAGDALGQARTIATRLLGREAELPPPDIYLYATGEALRKTSCVNTATAGYYDGAIHAAADDFDLERTIIHEFIHHVLNALGVPKPMWLHEGLAMFAAQETWWQDERLGLMRWLRTQHLPFEGLALAFPHSSDELFAGAVYYQSLRMVEFIFQASPDRGGIYRLVTGLRDGTIRAPTAFAQATGLSGDALERAWKQFIESR